MKGRRAATRAAGEGRSFLILFLPFLRPGSGMSGWGGERTTTDERGEGREGKVEVGNQGVRAQTNQRNPSTTTQTERERGAAKRSRFCMGAKKRNWVFFSLISAKVVRLIRLKLVVDNFRGSSLKRTRTSTVRSVFYRPTWEIGFLSVFSLSSITK